MLELNELTSTAIDNGWMLSGGSECRVIQCSDNAVYKIYRQEYLASDAMDRQQQAYENKLAPQVLSGLLEFIADEEPIGDFDDEPREHKYWGFMSEKVHTVDEEDYRDRIFKSMYFGSPTHERLTNKLITVFGRWKDLRPFNVGIKNNRYVAIDFGILSV
jgi:hypothetical protein